jgi:uncharacterized protein YndB with AHSA1/START domain
MLKTLALIAVLGVTLLLVYAATRPDRLHVQRSVHIAAPPEKIHALINDLHRFNTWNPYEKKDPNLRGRYEGPASGPGAAYHFEGNKDVGKGSLRIVESNAPARVAMNLEMIEPFAGTNVVEFTLAPQGSQTDVTWSMRGASPFAARLIGIFVDMDRMIGRDFETGLAALKAQAEAH